MLFLYVGPVVIYCRLAYFTIRSFCCVGLHVCVCFACQGLDEEHMSRLKGQRDALLAAREAREKDNGGEDFIALDGKVS